MHSEWVCGFLDVFNLSTSDLARRKTMKVIVGILLMFMGAASGSLVQDPVVCRFTENNQCSVALGQQLHLQMPLEDRLDLKFTDKTSTYIIKYRKTEINPPTPTIPGWKFVNDNKTMILTSAERSNSGTYRLETFDAGGKSKGIYSLQLNIMITEHTLEYTLGFVSVLLVILIVIAFYIYKKKRGLMNKEAQSEDGKEIAYGQVTHLPSSSTAKTPAQVQGDVVEYATVVTNPSQRNQKKKDEVQYGELVFNNPESQMPKVREECLYSEVKHGQ